MQRDCWIIGGVGLLSVLLPIARSLAAPVGDVPDSVLRCAAIAVDDGFCLPGDPLAISPDEDDLPQMRSVAELSDVQPTDWAYQAVRSLVEKYGVITGYGDRTFRGNRALSRDEFAATLSQVMTAIEKQLAQTNYRLSQDEFATLKRLQSIYQRILDNQRDRLDQLDAQMSTLETQNFSPTTQLNGQALISLTDGTAANTTLLTRLRLDLNTSFTGRDRLRTQLEVGNAGEDAIAKQHNSRGNLLGTLGILADGGGLDFIAIPTTVRVSKLAYTFQPQPNLSLTVGARLNPRDFIDANRFANDSLQNFSSSFFMNNPLIIQNSVDRPGGAGVAATWQMGDRRPFTLRALYVATDANTPESGLGLFGGNQQGSVEVEYATRPLVARWQYTRAHVNGTTVDAGGLNLEWAVRRQFALFSRVGIAHYAGFNTALQQSLDLTPVTWTVGGTLREILIPGSVAGMAIGQPFLTSGLGTATQTNAEVYYSFDLSDRLRVSPALLIVANPNNRATGTIFEWVVRVVYAF